MTDFYTQRWGLDCCKAFFRLTDGDEALIAGVEGQYVMQQMWDNQPDTFYEQPLQLLRQEWYQAMVPRYLHGGFWSTLPRQSTVLDYGGGVGALCQPWILAGNRTIVVETSRACQAYLRHKYPLETLTVVIPEALGSVRAGELDALVCTDVLEHVPNPLEVQDALWALLKPGGHALLKMESSYPHAGHLKAAVDQYPLWCRWLRDTTEILELGAYAWCRKKEHA